MSNEKLKKIIEHRFLKIRGWKNWKEYDKVGGSTQGDINCRNELIEIAIQETQNNSQEKPGKESAPKELGTTMMQKTSIPDSQQENWRKNGNSMSDAISTGINDSVEVGCADELSHPVDTRKGKKGRGRLYGY